MAAADSTDAGHWHRLTGVLPAVVIVLDAGFDTCIAETRPRRSGVVVTTPTELRTRQATVELRRQLLDALVLKVVALALCQAPKVSQRPQPSAPSEFDRDLGQFGIVLTVRRPPRPCRHRRVRGPSSS